MKRVAVNAAAVVGAQRLSASTDKSHDERTDQDEGDRAEVLNAFRHQRINHSTLRNSFAWCVLKLLLSRIGNYVQELSLTIARVLISPTP